MPKRTRAYLRTAEEEFRPLLWVRNNKPNEMVLGLDGLCATIPILQCMWPECTVEPADFVKVNYDYSSAVKLGVPLDHITCHVDGRFHLKKQGGKDIYIQRMQRSEPLGAATSTFLDLAVISDLAKHYAPSRVEDPHVDFRVNRDQYLEVRGKFSGTNYDVEQEMRTAMAQFRGHYEFEVVLESGTVKGVLMAQPKTLSGEAQAARPRGTLVSFRFPLTDGTWHLKAFLFQ